MDWWQQPVFLDGRPVPRRDVPRLLTGYPIDVVCLVLFTAEEDSPWEPHIIERGPRHFVSVWKNRVTGELRDTLPGRGAPPQKDVADSLRNSPISYFTDVHDAGPKSLRIASMTDGTVGIFKPADTEEADLRTTVKSNYYLREVAASEIADLVGMESHVPKAVVRTVGSRVGSMQEYVADAKVACDAWFSNQYGSSNEDLARCAAFDYLIGNADRHSGNWLISNSTGKIVLIDHGLCFPHGHGDFVYKYLLQKAQEKSLGVPPEVKEWIKKAPQIDNILKARGLSYGERRQTMLRLTRLSQAESFQDLQMPFDDVALGETFKDMMAELRHFFFRGLL